MVNLNKFTLFAMFVSTHIPCRGRNLKVSRLCLAFSHACQIDIANKKKWFTLANFLRFCCFIKQEPDSFAYAYEKRGTLLGGTQLRSNYYPMIADISKVKPGQIRCGEHTDYGGIALLIQDDAGGLEVRMEAHDQIWHLSNFEIIGWKNIETCQNWTSPYE